MSRTFCSFFSFKTACAGDVSIPCSNECTDKHAVGSRSSLKVATVVTMVSAAAFSSCVTSFATSPPLHPHAIRVLSPNLDSLMMVVAEPDTLCRDYLPLREKGREENRRGNYFPATASYLHQLSKMRADLEKSMALTPVHYRPTSGCCSSEQGTNLNAPTSALRGISAIEKPTQIEPMTSSRQRERRKATPAQSIFSEEPISNSYLELAIESGDKTSVDDAWPKDFNIKVGEEKVYVGEKPNTCIGKNARITSSDNACQTETPSSITITPASTTVPMKGRTKRLVKIMSNPKLSTFDSSSNKANSSSRSSTMPGFITRSLKNTDVDGQCLTARVKALEDGLKLVEEQTGRSDIRKLVNSAKEKQKRRKLNSEAMYNGSASVPDSLIAFTNEIHLESRISSKEEKELGTKTQEAVRLQHLHDRLVLNLHREPTDDEWCAAAGKINTEALRLAIEDGVEAKNRLVTANLRMVQGVVNLYIRNGLGSQYNAGDLMQEGIVALIRAAEKFEPTRGFRFSTYAMYWIRAAVKRSQILQSRVINVPQRVHATHKKITKVKKELISEFGCEPSKAQLADAVGISKRQLDRCKAAIAQECYSLDAEIQNTLKANSGDRNKNSLYDILDAKVDDPEYKRLQRLFMKEDLIGTLRRYLTPHEVDLLLLRYGLMDERTLPHGFSGPLTIAEVSRLVGLKPDKVRRMINGCLRQLRHLIAHEWEDFEKVSRM